MIRIFPSIVRQLTRTRAIAVRSLTHGHSVVFDGVTDALEADLLFYSRRKQVPVRLQDLIDTGKGDLLAPRKPGDVPEASNHERIQMQIACFLHRELPIRLAHRAVQLESNELLRNAPHVRLVCSQYKVSFAQLRDLPVPTTVEKEQQFATALTNIYERHSTTLIHMAKGAHEIRTVLKHNNVQFAESVELQELLDDFYMSRIGIRILIGQYLAIREPPTSPDMIGLVSSSANVKQIAQEAVESASYICSRVHGDAPSVIFQGSGQDLSFPYIPSHINYILLELLKNSMRATVELHGVDDPPPIRVVIANGTANEDVVIKVSDEGGGIKRSNLKHIWSYLYTTGNPAILNQILDQGEHSVADFANSTPLAGLGYGLPISRNYARYFGGDMTIMSMEGFGTDSFIYLPRLKAGDQSTNMVR